MTRCHFEGSSVVQMQTHTTKGWVKRGRISREPVSNQLPSHVRRMQTPSEKRPDQEPDLPNSEVPAKYVDQQARTSQPKGQSILGAAGVVTRMLYSYGMLNTSVTNLCAPHLLCRVGIKTLVLVNMVLHRILSTLLLLRLWRRAVLFQDQQQAERSLQCEGASQ